MPKIIIANAYELYYTVETVLSDADRHARMFYNSRFIWLLEEGDVIILSELPSSDFLAYFAAIKKIDITKVHFLALKNNTALRSETLLDAEVIQHLRHIIKDPGNWYIQACCYNKNIAALACNLSIPVDDTMSDFIARGVIHTVNSKSGFRRIALNNHISVAEGIICHTEDEFIQAIRHLIKCNGMVIIKQDYNAAGKGNIGITRWHDSCFTGVYKTIVITIENRIEEIAAGIWGSLIDSTNQVIVVEVYHPNKGSFTAQYWIPEKGENPALLEYSEIRMHGCWYGVEFPPVNLNSLQVNTLLSCSYRLAQIMQEYGYQGYICCDAILAENDSLLMTEVNVRPGAETHAYTLAAKLRGENKTIFLTRKGLKTTGFAKTHQNLKDRNLLFNTGNDSGVIILTIDEKYTGELEIMVIAPSLETAHALEQKAMRALS
jgi:hypothetical protein